MRALSRPATLSDSVRTSRSECVSLEKVAMHTHVAQVANPKDVISFVRRKKSEARAFISSKLFILPP